MVVPRPGWNSPPCRPRTIKGNRCQPSEPAPRQQNRPTNMRPDQERFRSIDRCPVVVGPTIAAAPPPGRRVAPLSVCDRRSDSNVLYPLHHTLVRQITPWRSEPSVQPGMKVDMDALVIEVAPELRLFLAPRDRHDAISQPYDGTSSLGHVVESVGVPLPEVGALLVGGRSVEPRYRPADGDEVRVLSVRRPQAAPSSYVLDVHLGVLARRLRLLGVDTAYANDADDDALIEQANREGRVLLTQDRALLRRRRLWLGAYVRGSRPDDQLRDVLDRFAPRLAPWTRCPACNGALVDV